MTTRPNPHLAWTLIVDDPALRGTLHPCGSTPVGCERGHVLLAALDTRHGYHQNPHSPHLYLLPRSLDPLTPRPIPTCDIKALNQSPPKISRC